jgi:hypothetical protein
MARFCVFCGKKPEAKNNEHILPLWLLELTGDPKREVSLGVNWSLTIKNERKFSYDSFKFPACASCNNDYSLFEDKAQKVMVKVINRLAINDLEVICLLDWFDKVRIGLWLAYHCLDKNMFGITPKFHISNRVGMQDRLLKIYLRDSEWKGLTFSGVTTPSFYHSPCCFMLYVNEFAFLNASSVNLFSRRLGFPYYEKQYADSNDLNIVGVIRPGLERTMLPLINKRFSLKGTELYQPIYKTAMKDEMARTYYNTDYVLVRSIDQDKGLGKIFIQKKRVEIYPSVSTLDWIPSICYEKEHFVRMGTIDTLEFQILINDLHPSYERLEKKEQKILNYQNKQCNKANKLIIDQVLKSAKT